MTFDELVNKHLQERKEGEDKFLNKEPNNFHCSEAGKCLRYLYLDRIEPIDNKDGLLRVFMLGHIFHEYIQTNMLKDFKIEEKFVIEYPKFVISGMIDAYNDKEVIELKTCSNILYQKEPRPEHIYQANLYLHHTNLPIARIVYINKNDFATKEFEIRYNKELYNDTINDFEYLQESMENKVDPLKVTPKICVECYRCKYYKRCFGRKK